ncbi:hypothetical protein PFISCL1PPCAC_24227, partial [Pristionchus fissidentatus]
FRMHSLYALLFSSLAFAVYAKEQSVGARGTLMCGNQPLVNAEVKLWELDTFPDPDDLLATVHTDRQGHFQISGHEAEMTTISPVLKIYHRCNNKNMFNLPGLCKRKITYEIPKNYITPGKTASRFYDMGVLNMEAKMPKEATECI